MKESINILSILLVSTIAAFSQEVKFSGSFEADSYFTTFKGDWKIQKEGEDLYIVFGESFEAKKAPDLKIFMSKITFDDIDAKNASSKENSVLIEKLKIYKGPFKTKIPKGINLSDYNSLIVHCEKYEKLWGGSPLR